MSIKLAQSRVGKDNSFLANSRNAPLLLENKMKRCSKCGCFIGEREHHCITKIRKGNFNKCQNCRKKFYTFPGYKNAKFCSIKCRGKFYRGKPRIGWSERLKKIYKMKSDLGYQKGHKSFPGCEKGWFKKGHIPAKPFKRGERSANYKGGKLLSGAGYILILKPEHPFASKTGYIREHRLVMEKILKRYLKPKEKVHHRNGIRSDNRPENLALVVKTPHYGKIECPFCNKEFFIR